MLDATSYSALRPPAVCLIVVAVISIVVFAIGIAIDVSIVTVSLNRRSNVFQHAMTRIPFAVVLILINFQVIRGGWAMLRLKKYNLARQAAVLAMIPCASPCFVLGIPFAIWAFRLLNDANVKNMFADPPAPK